MVGLDAQVPFLFSLRSCGYTGAARSQTPARPKRSKFADNAKTGDALMDARMRRVLRLTAVALLLIVTANGILLWDVARNRSAVPEAELRLSEREFFVPQLWRGENSGRFLQLRYQYIRSIGDDGAWLVNPWLDREKLRDLGFYLPEKLVDAENPRRVPRFPQKKVFLVLELAGPAYSHALAQARAEVEAWHVASAKEGLQDPKEHLHQIQEKNSRLFVVDAGLDVEALRRHYPKRQQYAIVPGRVHIWWNAPQQQEEPEFYSRLVLEHERIFVPLDFAPQLALLEEDVVSEERGRVKRGSVVQLAFGTRLQPWIVGIREKQ